MAAISIVNHTLAKNRFWNKYGHRPFNERQVKIINRLWDGFEGKLNNSKWTKINHCSAATALRDIQQLVEWGVLIVSATGGRSTSYTLVAEETVDK